MISKTRLLALVKAFDRKAVERGLVENPTLLGHRDERGRNWLHVCCGVGVKHFRMIGRHGARGDIPNGKGITAAEIMSRKRAPAFRAMAGQLARCR